MNDFEPDEARLHQIFAALRAGWRTRVDLADRVRNRLTDFDERFTTPAADRLVGRGLVSWINAISFVLGAAADDANDNDPTRG